MTMVDEAPVDSGGGKTGKGGGFRGTQQRRGDGVGKGYSDGTKGISSGGKGKGDVKGKGEGEREGGKGKGDVKGKGEGEREGGKGKGNVKGKGKGGGKGKR
eukprot:gene2933-2345_t